jgi:transposase
VARRGGWRQGLQRQRTSEWLQERDIEAVIPYREDESGDHAYDRAAYRERSVIERTINRLKRYRRGATAIQFVHRYLSTL